jgi:hypothetical protein
MGICDTTYCRTVTFQCVKKSNLSFLRALCASARAFLLHAWAKGQGKHVNLYGFNPHALIINWTKLLSGPFAASRKGTGQWLRRRSPDIEGKVVVGLVGDFPHGIGDERVRQQFCLSSTTELPRMVP